ncbi:DUF4153 domain-containing protein [Sulfidibacter corallicola]|uniref:DUF4173 domain-containing protein n=1 Tax=Sulfidibacter corallicola TaxID=2818388 RepID=A0A8A4TRZ5_SULCO|nr:DUF4173 domain-containing protein [Sulfidibacter corallicola]QTD52167.1 DUF4173 domain-containing protein [Sulfidibacter corallicola]
MAIDLFWTVALLLIFDILFYRSGLGLNFALGLAATTLALWVTHPNVRDKRIAYRLSFAVGGLALAAAIDYGPLVLHLGTALTIALALTMREGWIPSPRDWSRRFGHVLLRGWFSAPRDAFRALRIRERRMVRRPAGSHLDLRQTAIIGAIGFVFSLLFALANPIFADFVGRSTDWLTRRIAFSRILFWIFLSGWVWALLRFRARLKAPKTRPIPGLAIRRLDPSYTLGCLWMCNGIFAINSGLDLFYLWGEAPLPDGMTYAQFAHRGAYLLVLTALLAAAFILTMTPRREDGAAAPRIRGLLHLWTFQNVLLTCSSMRRLWIYVDAYQLTRLRLAAAIWMALVAMGLILIFWSRWRHRDNRWLVIANCRVCFAVLYFCCFFDFEGFISNYNATNALARSKALPDLQYFRVLGPKSLPAVDRLLDEGRFDASQRLQLTFVREDLLQEASKWNEDWRTRTLRSLNIWTRWYARLPDEPRAAGEPPPARATNAAMPLDGSRAEPGKREIEREGQTQDPFPND